MSDLTSHSIKPNPQPLQIEAERLAQVVRQNVPSHRRVGYGEDFWQFRSYGGGEPATMIDWRQSARSTRLLVREKDREPVQTIFLWADRSPCMHNTTDKSAPSKTEQAHLIVLALAHMLLRGGERVVWLDDYLMTTDGISGFYTLAERLLPIRPQEALPPIRQVSRHAHMVVASDFLASYDLWKKLVRSYAALDVHGTLVHICSPEDKEPDGSLFHLAKNVGWHYLSHKTCDTPFSVLAQIFDLLTARLREASSQENYTF